MSTRDITAQMEDLYGIDLSAETISRITDKVLPVVQQWQNRPLAHMYPVLYLDGLVVTVKSEGRYTNKTAHIIIGIDLDGHKNVLGIWLAENESSKFWLSVLTDLKNRGVQDVLIACVDGLTGFETAIKSVFPATEVQRCIVHQVRNCTRFVSYKDLKRFCQDMKAIYQSPTEGMALERLQEFSDIWQSKYAYAVKSWYQNWDALATFFKYSPELRKIIYTTNPIESYNRTIRKYTKTKGGFPSDDAVMKSLYLATCQAMEKWGRVRDWNLIVAQLIIHFEERIKRYL